MNYGFSSFDTGFQLMSILFPIVFLCILGVFVAVAIRGISTWNKNNHSPRLTVAATVVTKRTDVTRRSCTNDDHIGQSTTWSYVTFEVESGDRIEFSVSGSEYGMLAEGDMGKLTFQGTRYLSFVRDGALN